MGNIGTAIKWTVGLAVVGGLVVGGAGLFLAPSIKKLVEARNSETGERVRVQEIEPGRLVRTVSAPGELEPRRRIQISSRIAALIVEIPYEEGDFVKAGDMVVRLDDKEYKAQLDSARARMRTEQARLDGARASYLNAVAEWERLQELFNSADISKSELDAAETKMRADEAALHAAEHNVSAAEAAVVQAEENLSYTVIRSPIDGRVTTVNAEVGEIVVTGTMNNAGTVILEIADLSEMLVKAEIDETDIAPVREGQSVRVMVNAYPDHVFEGTVELVSLQSTYSQQDRAKIYETEILLHLTDDDATLYSGLTANVDIEIEEVEGVLLAPSQAVVELRTDELADDLRNSEWVDLNKTFSRIVYVVDGSRAKARPVKIGSSDLTQTAILGGLEPGDRIIVGPWKALQSIKDGDTVRIEGEDATEPAVAVAADEADEAGGESAASGDESTAKSEGGAATAGEKQAAS
jgi:HlyD family secretion protein